MYSVIHTNKKCCDSEYSVLLIMNLHLENKQTLVNVEFDLQYRNSHIGLWIVVLCKAERESSVT